MKRVILTILTLFSASYSHAENFMTTTFDKFAKAVFFTAWPSATYEEHTFFDINNSEKYITVKMTGKSMWDNKLELLIRVEFTNSYSYEDIEVERHNGIVPPFAIAGELAKLIKNMNSGTSYSSPETANYAYSKPTVPSSYNIVVHNKCQAPIKVAVHYKTVAGEWETQSWWKFDGNEKSFLSVESGRLTTKSNTVYVHAERQVENGRIWEGDDYTTYIGGEKIGFIKTVDDEGDHEINLSCS